MVEVILVRHGETDWNKLRRIQGGDSDTPLNENGTGQARAIALRLKKENIQAVYSSPLQRAMHTAHAIAQEHRLEVQPEPSLKELNVGGLEGVDTGTLRKRLDELLVSKGHPGGQIKTREDIWKSLEQAGGESLSQLQQRAWAALQRIVQGHDGTIVVVTHQFVIQCLICAALGLPVTQANRLRMTVGSISRIVFDERGTGLTLFNDTCHL
ncbi:MAG: histidine phosphatase family protein [Chloroflexi bacterium]|nr:histidine phosphatase family protein [Chloroflexota bacterium]